MTVITPSEIKVKLATKLGSAGNTLTQSDPNESLGKYISTTELVDSILNNLFDDISGEENRNQVSDYRCLFVHNSSGSQTYFNVYVTVDMELTDGAYCLVASDLIAAKLVGSADPQADEIANELVVPSTEYSFLTLTSLGNIPAGYCKAFWVKRIATNSGALNKDWSKIRVIGNTVQ